MDNGSDGATKRRSDEGAAPPAAPPEQRVSEIRGDRLCERCGFNLCGQMVLREGHYGLLIARCPECGQVAPMQEYPRRSKWAGRFVAFAAGAIVLVFVSVMIASAAAGWVATKAVAHVASAPVAAEIGLRFFDDTMKKARQDPLPAQWTQAEGAVFYYVLQTVDPTALRIHPWGGAGPPPQAVIDATEQQMAQVRQQLAAQGWWMPVDDAWWEQQDRRAIVRAARGGLRQVPVEGWLGISASALALGIGLALAQPHRKRLGLALWTLAPVGLAAGAALIWPPPPATAAQGWGWPGTVMTDGLAEREFWAAALGVTLGVAWVGLLAGAMIGRPLARLALRAILPPRLVGAFARLWVCDGLPPPRGPTRR